MAIGKADEPLGQQILKEWAVSFPSTKVSSKVFYNLLFIESKEISGIDKNQLLDNSPEARVTQLQTLSDIVSSL